MHTINITLLVTIGSINVISGRVVARPSLRMQIGSLTESASCSRPILGHLEQVRRALITFNCIFYFCRSTKTYKINSITL